MNYPEQYLHVYHNQSGEEFVVPIADDTLLDIEKLCSDWAESHFCGEANPEFAYGPESACLEYYARIITDGRSPDSCICWTSVGFSMEFVAD
jgi:hypothetical protein